MVLFILFFLRQWLRHLGSRQDPQGLWGVFLVVLGHSQPTPSKILSISQQSPSLPL